MAKKTKKKKPTRTGWDETEAGEELVADALKSGAVERLLLADVLVRTKKGEQLLRLAKNNNSDFTIINTTHDAGKKIDGIGGIAALLRFKI